MRHFTMAGSEDRGAAGAPQGAGPAFVAGMGRRMAAAGLRPSPPGLARADPSQAWPDADARPPARGLGGGRLGAAQAVTAIIGWNAAAKVAQGAALCVVAATGAGLLYWQKARVAPQNREIARIVQATQAVRARTAALKLEWAALDDPGRLQDMADRLLTLRPVAPAQFVEPAALSAWLEAPA